LGHEFVGIPIDAGDGIDRLDPLPLGSVGVCQFQKLPPPDVLGAVELCGIELVEHGAVVEKPRLLSHCCASIWPTLLLPVELTWLLLLFGVDAGGKEQPVGQELPVLPLSGVCPPEREP
jgi:hypothetical protein